ncbi:hypothetical protein FGO68_gene5448 [Halteria grandinella]|uniref:Fatty acid hydroxylase domain-containing protein n=1 Tax=Halteria grandinella TaxID=5974 RepID=A0A8J8NKM5_HALGN|nr:hypothetical protein FGO68_gene5448 [Halteria grandinella]
MSLYFVYHIEHPFFEKYKISKKPWPWQENKEEWRKTLKKSLKLVSFNSFVALPVTMIFFGALNNYQVPYALDVESIPDVPYFLLNILFQIVCEDLLLHFIHKWLHHPRLYTLIHKKHHEYVQSVCIASQYTHPIEFILLSALPNGLIALSLGKRMHITTMLMYNFAREFETHDGHCGYEFSWMPFRLIPFSTSAAYHDFHHSHNVGNYSSYLTFWDTLFGENKDYYQNKQVQRRIFKQS